MQVETEGAQRTLGIMIGTIMKQFNYTTKELLEFAAESIGGILHSEDCGENFYVYWIALPDKFKPWNPLENDGDALRLAVQLNLLTKHSFFDAMAEENNNTKDYYAATRRAIVNTAAKIGKEKILGWRMRND